MTKTLVRFVARLCLIASATIGCAADVLAQPDAKMPKVAPNSSAEPPQGYSVVLVLGDTQSGASVDTNVPAAARKALSDMKDFLPYKSYRLLDAQWILGSQRSSTRLRGSVDQEYELTLRAVMNGKLHVAFRLAEAGALDLLVRPTEVASQPVRIADLQRALRELEAEAAKAADSRSADKRAEDLKAAAAAKAQELRRAMEHPIPVREAVARPFSHAIIDTSFNMDVGETVVVGTSRVAGDKALIVLLTAVPRAR